MWYLQSMTDATQRFSLVPGKEMVVGRKDCDILINLDGSISRKHAVISISEGDPGVVTLTDCKSKFGTAVNGKKIGANLKRELCRDDVIRFGQGPTPSRSQFKLVFEPLVFCCSAMSKSENSSVKQSARALGAEVVSNWSERCSHLIMTGITVTVKVVSALSSCKPVVTPAWVEEALRCRKSSLPLPSPSSFQPDVVDTNIGHGTHDGGALSFAPNYSRTSLFQDRVFYFLSEKQFVRLKPCLHCAGASCQLINAPNSIPLETLLKEQSVVLAVDQQLLKQATPTEQKWIQQVCTHLRSNDLRVVLDSEIGFALLFISTEEYCNPRATTSALMSSSTPMAPPTLSQAPYTQQPHTSSQHTLTHQHTLPYTQDTMVHTQERTTILAPDSLDQSQPQKKSSTKTSTDSSVQKVNETIMSVKSSFDKSGSLEKRQLRVKTEEATVQSIQSEVKKGPVPYRTDVKSSENSVKSIATSSVIDTASVKGKEIDILFGEEMDEDCSAGPPAGVHQGDEEAEKERDVSDGSQLSRQKARMKLKKSPRQTTHHSQQTQPAIKKPPHYHEASATRTADIDGDRGKNGDCVFTEPALTLPGPPRQNNSSGSNDKKIVPTCEIPQDSKQQNKNLNNCSTQNSSKVPDDTASVPKPSPKTPSSLSSITSPTQLEGSIIVPCSLTPQTQNNKAKKPPNPLPDSQTLAFAFQSRRKKRTHQQTCDKELGAVEGENQSKKMKKGCEVLSGGERVRGKGERNVVMELEMKKQDAVEVKEAEQVTEPEQKGKGKNNTHNNTNTGSFCEINNKPSNTGKQNDPNRDSECKRMKTLPSIMTGLPLLECHEDSEVKCKQSNQPPQPPSTDLNTERKTVKSKKVPSDVMVKKSKEKPNSNKSTGQCLSQRTSPTPCTQQTAPPPTPDPALFLSTRKKRRKSPRDDSMAAPTTPDRPTSRPVSPYTQHTSTTQLALTTTQRTGVSLTTPFTSLVTGGRRTKASDRENTVATLWEDDTNQLDGEDPLINRPDDDVSKKVYKPVYDEDGFVCSRIKPSVQTSRIGRLAAFADSQLSNSSDHTDNVTNSLPEAVAEIVFARLVVVTNDRGKKRRREGTRKMDERTNNGVRNFKKFHKIQHIGLGTIPRLVSLKEYVPPTSRELQDWIGEYENISEVGQEQQDSSSQDLFRFTTITTSSRRQHRRT